jgi:hypothetical protein
MTDAMMLSSIALGISMLVSVFKVFDWYINTDPKEVMKTGRRVLIGLSMLAMPLLAALLFYQQRSLAVLLGAGILIAFTVFGYRALLPIRAVFRLGMREDRSLGTPSGNFADGRFDDPELVRRSAEILAAYLDRVENTPTLDGAETGARHRSRQAGAASWDGTMSREEALDVLGLDADADILDIRKAHRRLVQMVHPDRGGSNYLTMKINQAKEVLLGDGN